MSTRSIWVVLAICGLMMVLGAVMSSAQFDGFGGGGEYGSPPPPTATPEIIEKLKQNFAEQEAYYSDEEKLFQQSVDEARASQQEIRARMAEQGLSPESFDDVMKLLATELVRVEVDLKSKDARLGQLQLALKALQASEEDSPASEETELRIRKQELILEVARKQYQAVKAAHEAASLPRVQLDTAAAEVQAAELDLALEKVRRDRAPSDRDEEIQWIQLQMTQTAVEIAELTARREHLRERLLKTTAVGPEMSNFEAYRARLEGLTTLAVKKTDEKNTTQLYIEQTKAAIEKLKEGDAIPPHLRSLLYPSGGYGGGGMMGGYGGGGMGAEYGDYRSDYGEGYGGN